MEMDGGARLKSSTGTSGWTWQKLSASFVFAANSAHMLTISHREDGSRIDKILITTDQNYTPSGVGGN